MQLNWLDRVGDWNPQLFREIKGRLKVRNVALAVATSLLGQLVLFLFWLGQVPDFAFAFLSEFVLFTLLVVGTYMLISDLAQEERRGTLNFIRLSPQSSQSILSGKMLGVPILLYLAVVFTIPLHLWLGLSVQIPLVEIISFWAVLVASCAFFYSGALLFGLVSSWLGGFQAWLGSGAVLFFLWIAHIKPIDHTPLDWLNLFCPSVVLPYLVDRTGSPQYREYTEEFPFSHGVIQQWEWFDFPLGATGVSLVIFVLLNYGLWTGWIWQALKRCFCNPNTTILSKRQSYWLVACFEVVILGFTMGDAGYSFGWPEIFINPFLVAFFNLLLFLGLMAVLSPHRQVLQDWARYRHQRVSTRKGFWNRALVQDLILGEKSPALIAIAINLVIASTPFFVWILLLQTEYLYKIKGLFTVAFFISLMMIYASIFQLMLLMKSNKRSLWATGTVAALLVLTRLILGVLSIDTTINDTAWLFPTFRWVGIENGATITNFMALLGEWAVLVLLNLQLTRQLRRAGESASKALFTKAPVH
jgi:hypothetical protein